MRPLHSSASKPKELEELRELARLATLEALREHKPLPLEWKENLTLGTFFDGEDRVFELYVAAERPADAIVICSARANRQTRSVQVTVSNLAKKAPEP